MEVLSIFGENLKELMIYNETSAGTMSEKVGIDPSQIRRYLRGESLPTLKNAIKIADALRCPLDYLFGLTSDFTEKEYPPAPPFSKHFPAFLEKCGYSRYKLAREIKGLTQSRLSAWANDRGEPTVENLLKIAAHLSCSLDELVGRER